MSDKKRIDSEFVYEPNLMQRIEIIKNNPLGYLRWLRDVIKLENHPRKPYVLDNLFVDISIIINLLKVSYSIYPVGKLKEFKNLIEEIINLAEVNNKLTLVYFEKMFELIDEFIREVQIRKG